MSIAIPQIEQEVIEEKIPHLLKYMGAKREILGFVTKAIDHLNVETDWFCDLFAGTSVVGASVKSRFNIHSNDIQQYSSVLSKTYLTDLRTSIPLSKVNEIKIQAEEHISAFRNAHSELVFGYAGVTEFKDVSALEKAQQDLINRDFNVGFHLFTKYYSGTYWSFDQCLWIDALRCVAESYKDKTEYYAIMSSLISAMSYVSQSTGHYAQYRDLTESNLNDILGYRNREIWFYFQKKFTELLTSLNGTAVREYLVTNLDYLDCLSLVKSGSIIYADPPYQSVHYSRFYHALETLVKYDYPVVAYKGRYREDRHQSPFCKKTTVKQAFINMFTGVKAKDAHLALSYSDTGMIKLEDITDLGNDIFNEGYETSVLELDYKHSTMGRSDERQQDVKEYIILFKKL